MCVCVSVCVTLQWNRSGEVEQTGDERTALHVQRRNATSGYSHALSRVARRGVPATPVCALLQQDRTAAHVDFLIYSSHLTTESLPFCSCFNHTKKTICCGYWSRSYVVAYSHLDFTRRLISIHGFLSHWNEWCAACSANAEDADHLRSPGTLPSLSWDAAHPLVMIQVLK